MRTIQLKPCLLVILFTLSFSSYATEIWVATNGTDNNPGTKEKPLATLSHALFMAQQLRLNSTTLPANGIHIIIKGGYYYLTKPIVITTSMQGTANCPLYIEAAPNEIPIFSGGIPVTKWQKATNITTLPTEISSKLLVAKTPMVNGVPLHFRELWINNNKATRASTLNNTPLQQLTMANKVQQSLTVPNTNSPRQYTNGMELVAIQDWAIAILRIQNLVNNKNTTTLTFKEPESTIEFKRPWPQLIAEANGKNNLYYYLANALEFIDTAGEWYNNANTAQLYYLPKPNETTSNCQATVPVLENLITIEGEDTNNTIGYITFKGIGFTHTTWLRPSNAGHVPLQAGQYIYNAYLTDSIPSGNVAWVGRQPAAVTVKNAHHINFYECTFEHIAATGLDYVSATHHNNVTGCIFKDIGGTALQAGYFGDDTFEVHTPYNPTNKKLVCTNLTFTNNLITDATNQYWGTHGICVGYAANTTIAHNEVSHVNYSAISIGWGWTTEDNCMENNVITANYVHHYMNRLRDGGGIYTLSAQKNSIISNNRIEQMGAATYNAKTAAHCIYLDIGTDWFTITNNYTDIDAFNTNQNGTHNKWGKNGNTIAVKIKNAAGLEPEYKHLLTNKISSKQVN